MNNVKLVSIKINGTAHEYALKYLMNIITMTTQDFKLQSIDPIIFKCNSKLIL